MGNTPKPKRLTTDNANKKKVQTGKTPTKKVKVLWSNQYGNSTTWKGKR